ncbi:beta family protein [Burkholderia territorii]|uniref:beta family protein n=1 Tax=Burkholderia territorii TaxID=1503055 RepID=UPI001E29DF5F|nr:beta family protein [Burkholderia territorii]
MKDYNQYYDLAKKVVTDIRYRTREYSFGDSYIDDCARKLGKPGAPGTWVRADMNHHVTYVAEQVDRLVKVFASLPNPADAAALLTAV